MTTSINVMTRDLDSSLLRAFVTVAETGAVGVAAARLARTQAAVSMQLRRLEEELGQRLLDRSPRGVQLTEAGHLLLPFAHAILGAGADARRALSAGQVSGTVRLGMLEDIAVGRLPRALRRFSIAYPQVALEIVVDTSSALSNRLADGGLDVVVGDPALVDSVPLLTWTQPLFWVGARGFSRDDGAVLPVVAFGGACLWQQQVLTALRRAGIAWRIVCTSTSLPAVQSAVEAGLGVSVLLDGNIRSESMRVLGQADGLPDAPTADFGLFMRPVSGAQAAAVQTLQTFLCEELHLGLRESEPLVVPAA
ncbi:LysR substrate-binding domain-containing protein [Paraburkholderia madseniana]|uniref:LysR substrate-binding domain-containing protein n=1 Tax=Paraburkholderia madseniana TaxID=2599607 RepID=A0AAP5ES98_9BURK|nr:MULTISPECIES: LysR substrate-binding domain-containing protein [Paraburkholderia]MCX4151204.1 LysR substrate-binding domain-containing protein [Paraburkholderia madseniana]MDN7154136.1 LysR substrate-binding domain-containing protein [Paraburkholderia sp. WS6]MDQ6413018.1 LysR substrate-binding domain-containing protein [Paraburkholderia madseniana]